MVGELKIEVKNRTIKKKGKPRVNQSKKQQFYEVNLCFLFLQAVVKETNK